MLSKYLTATYEDGGRTWPRVDCWGLTIIARAELFSLPMLSHFGRVDRHSTVSFQRAYRTEVERALEEGAPVPGAIAAALRRGNLVHVGLVVQKDGRQQVLEINPGSQARIVRLSEFIERFDQVVFYRDRTL